MILTWARGSRNLAAIFVFTIFCETRAVWKTSPSDLQDERNNVKFQDHECCQSSWFEQSQCDQPHSVGLMEIRLQHCFICWEMEAGQLSYINRSNVQSGLPGTLDTSWENQQLEACAKFDMRWPSQWFSSSYQNRNRHPQGNLGRSLL